MINPTDPPTDQQIHYFKPTINQSQPTDPTMTQTPDPTHFSHNPTTTQTSDPTTTHNLFRHRSQQKKKTTTTTVTHAVNHAKKKKKATTEPLDCNPPEKLSHCDVWCMLGGEWSLGLKRGESKWRKREGRERR